MIQIALSNSEKFAFIDDADHALVKKHVWRLQKDQWREYACTAISPDKSEGMGRLLLGLAPREKLDGRLLYCDHKDRNGLNNTRANIRVCTGSQNGMNKLVSKHSLTGIKGICIDPTGKFLYRTSLTIMSKVTKLGASDDIFEVARIYNDGVEKYTDGFGIKINVDEIDERAVMLRVRQSNRFSSLPSKWRLKYE